MADEVYSLDWEVEIDDGSEFEYVVFEPGDYDFTVKSFERGIAKESGNNMAILELEITDGERKAIVKDWIVLTNKTIWKIASFFRSIGMKKKGKNFTTKWKETVGKTGRCTLTQEDKESQKGKTYKINKIDAYLDPPQEEEFKW